MNCDQAFEALTDPVDRPATELQRHLKSCARCRQMQAVLEPALALLADETPPVLAARGEAGCRQLLSPETIQIAEQASARLQRRSRRSSGARTRIAAALAGCIAVFLLGGLTTLGLLTTVQEQDVFEASMPAAQSSDDCLWLARDDDEQRGSSRTVVLSCVSCHLPGSAMVN